ncbi:MAG TPA: hypothetical protein VK595_10310, partial [Vicinamibacterales bacterium]|nr:hypothetical protein [Vicinamibacterales bacterium]
MAFNVGALNATLGFLVDDDGAQRFERKIKTLRGDAAKPVTAELRGDLNPRDLDLYQAKLKEIRGQVAKRDQFKAQLGADYNAKAFNAYERDLKRTQRETDNTVRAQGRLRTAFGSVSGAGAGMFAAAGGGYAVYAGLKSIVSASGEAETSAKRVATAVDNAGISYEKHADRIDKVIQKQSRLARMDDEELADSFAKFAGLTEDVNKALELNALSADLARGRQIELEAASKLVTRAYTGQVAGLRRVGIDIEPVTKAQDELKESTKKYTKEQEAAAKEADKVASRQKALAALQRQFGGQAREYGRSQQGALEGVAIAWENLRETLGQKLAPTITTVSNRIARFVTQMDEGRGQGGRFVDTLKDIWTQAKRVGERIADVGGFLKDHIGLVSGAAGAWVAYKAAVKGAAAVSGVRALLGRSGAAAAAPGAVAGGPAAAAAAAAAVGIAAYTTYKADQKKGDDAAATIDRLNAALDRLDRLGAKGGLSRLRKQYDAIITSGKSFDEQADAINKLAESAEKLGDRTGDLRAVAGEVKRARDRFREFAKDGGSDIREIRGVVKFNMGRIKDNLGEDTEAGAKALAGNFKAARKAVREAMKDGTVTVREGLAEIKRLMRRELKDVYGLSPGAAFSIAEHGDIKGQAGLSGSGVGKAGGGWIGAPGMV